MTRVPDNTETRLVASLAAGDHSAFEAIYRKHAGKLYSYARRNLYNKEDCEEIVQDVFESLWIRRREIEIRSCLEAYLMGMVRYKVIEHFRKTGLHKKYCDHFALFQALYDQAEDPALNHAAIESALVKLISELPERCQQALRLRLSEDLSNPDIARRMNISTRTVEVYMFRAFNHIRACYKQYVAQISIVLPFIGSIFRLP